MRLILLLSLIAPALSAAGAPKPLTYTSATVKAHGDPQNMGEAYPASPTAAASPAPSSATAAASGASVTAEAEDDEAAAKPTVFDLSQAETALLAKISAALDKDAPGLLFSLEEAQPVEKRGVGVAEVKANELYQELAARLQKGDKDAAQALAKAIAKGDLRARGAKDLAFEDKLANSYIKRLGNGDKGAKAELEKLAAKGNAKAREFLGLDKPKAPADGAPKGLSPAAEAK